MDLGKIDLGSCSISKPGKDRDRSGPGFRPIPEPADSRVSGSECRSERQFLVPDDQSAFDRLAELEDDSAHYEREVERIVTAYLPLADRLARRFEGRGEPRDDLAQVARLGLVKAVQRFDTTNGANFSAFAVPTITGEIRRHFRDNGWSVKVPRRLKDLSLHLRTANAELSQSLGRAPNISELASSVAADRDEVIEAWLAGNAYKTVSIDNSSGTDGPTGAIIDRHGELDCNLKRVEDRESVRRILAELSDDERTALQLRFFESRTQTQIAEQLGVSQMQVSRLLAKSLARLRNRLS